MSLPTDLRVLCFQLSTTAAQDLPRLLPTLLQRLTRCQLHLSSPAQGSSSGSDASASSVLVHKLKTQIHTLFKGQSLEGRFAAVALTKTAIEVGGWEVLHGPELKNWWIPGLHSILVKPDSSAAKELCILTLTKIYCLTSQNQTLVREVTSPTLPAFLTCCLNLVAPKSTTKRMGVSVSLTEVVFRAFAALLPRYPTLFRSEASRIRLAARPYLAPTCADSFVPSSLQESARQLVTLIHLSAAKNSGGEEWGKAVRNTIQRIHVTSDQVFRAVIEDWESTAGYMGEAVDIDRELAGGSNEADDLPPWTGIYAGVDRLAGLLAILEEHIRGETFAPVLLPLGAIMDMATRVLSVAAPCSSESSGGLRLHPAVDRDEREGLWSGLPQIHAASLQLIEAVVDRLQEGFIPLAGGVLDQLAWIFPYGKSDLPFRCRAYCLARKLLLLVGKSLDRRQTSKLVPIIRLCCKDLIPSDPYYAGSGTLLGGSIKEPNTLNPSDATSKQAQKLFPEDSSMRNTTAAGELLPLLVSHVPQTHLDISIRALIERTAILAHHSGTLLACIMTPFVGKDGRAISSIMPYATRGLADEPTLELLLRPRMPLLPATSDHVVVRESTNLELEDDDIAMRQGTPEGKYGSYTDTPTHAPSSPGGPGLPYNHAHTASAKIPSSQHGFGNTRRSESPPKHSGFSFAATGHAPDFVPVSSSVSVSGRSSGGAGEDTRRYMEPSRQMERDDIMDEGSPDSSDESVHLTMEMDTDPEDEVDG